MKKLLLSALLGVGVFVPASAIFLVPTSTNVNHSSDATSYTLTWSEPVISSDVDLHPASYYHVTVYKVHTATADEEFVLASTDFNDVTSTGTMTRPKDMAEPWKHLPDMPGWYVKFPMYMNNALGIDAFQYFAGSDNGDPLGGTYIASPDYHLQLLSDPTLHLSFKTARANNTDKAGAAVYTWSDDFWTPGVEDYKPIMEQVWESDAIDNQGWTPQEITLVPDEYLARTRVALYGSGSYVVWYDDIKLSVNLKAGETIMYPAAVYTVNGTSYTADKTADTDNDFIYGFQVRGIWEDYDDYRDNHYIRSMSDVSPIDVVHYPAGIEGIEADVDNANAPVEYFNLQGQRVEPSAPGLYIRRQGAKSTKVVL